MGVFKSIRGFGAKESGKISEAEADSSSKKSDLSSPSAANSDSK